MPNLLRLRPLTEEETREIPRLAPARTVPARAVERARIVWQALQGERVPAITHALSLTDTMVRLWIPRFNAHAMDGLEDGARSGRRPPISPPAEVADVVGCVWNALIPADAR